MEIEVKIDNKFECTNCTKEVNTENIKQGKKIYNIAVFEKVGNSLTHKNLIICSDNCFISTVFKV